MPSADAEVPVLSVPPTCLQGETADTGALADPGHMGTVLVGSCHDLTAIPQEQLRDYYRGHAWVGLAALALGAAFMSAFW